MEDYWLLRKPGNKPEEGIMESTLVLNSQYHLPWMCMIDFNKIVLAMEKLGGSDRAQQQMEGFR